MSEHFIDRTAELTPEILNTANGFVLMWDQIVDNSVSLSRRTWHKTFEDTKAEYDKILAEIPEGVSRRDACIYMCGGEPVYGEIYFTWLPKYDGLVRFLPVKGEENE